MTNPPVGGDTLWASGYEAYERLTPPFQKFVEGLTAIHSSKVSSLFVCVGIGCYTDCRFNANRNKPTTLWRLVLLSVALQWSSNILSSALTQ